MDIFEMFSNELQSPITYSVTDELRSKLDNIETIELVEIKNELSRKDSRIYTLELKVNTLQNLIDNLTHKLHIVYIMFGLLCLIIFILLLTFLT